MAATATVATAVAVDLTTVYNVTATSVATVATAVAVNLTTAYNATATVVAANMTAVQADVTTAYNVTADSNETLSDDQQMSELYKVPALLVIVLSVLYGSISVIAVAGNGLVIWAIVTSNRMRSVTNHYLANLAFADILIALFAVPFEVSHRMRHLCCLYAILAIYTVRGDFLFFLNLFIRRLSSAEILNKINLELTPVIIPIKRLFQSNSYTVSPYQFSIFQ